MVYAINFYKNKSRGKRKMGVVVVGSRLVILILTKLMGGDEVKDAMLISIVLAKISTHSAVLSYPKSSSVSDEFYKKTPFWHKPVAVP